jgi:hypothetical protein
MFFDRCSFVGEILDTIRFWPSLYRCLQVASWSLWFQDGDAVSQSLSTVAPANPMPVLGIQVNTTVCSVRISTQPSPTVVEGKPFVVQPTVNVTTAAGTPVAGKVVYALISEGNGFRYPFLLQPDQTSTVMKQLVNVSAVTDAMGVATFTDLGFQVRGREPCLRSHLIASSSDCLCMCSARFFQVV